MPQFMMLLMEDHPMHRRLLARRHRCTRPVGSVIRRAGWRAALWAGTADALDHVPGKQEDGNADDAGGAHLDWFVFSHSHGSVSSRD
jgi:hypothetical protein